MAIGLAIEVGSLLGRYPQILGYSRSQLGTEKVISGDNGGGNGPENQRSLRSDAYHCRRLRAHISRYRPLSGAAMPTSHTTGFQRCFSFLTIWSSRSARRTTAPSTAVHLPPVPAERLGAQPDAALQDGDAQEHQVPSR